MKDVDFGPVGLIFLGFIHETTYEVDKLLFQRPAVVSDSNIPLGMLSMEIGCLQSENDSLP